jgi:hypothetical protein
VRTPDGKIIKFDDPNAPHGMYQGTFGSGINAWEEVAADYFDANFAFHAFIWYPSGRLTNFECQDAGTGSYQGTVFNMNNSRGAIQGFCIDQNNVSHGLLLVP